MAYLKKFIWRAAFTYRSRGYITYPAPLAYSAEVLQAKAENKPIVALESTIITHGMPYPQNLETALQVEDIIRQRGAIPATVAILKGQLTVGLTNEQLQYLAQAKNVVKASRRDLAPVVAAKLDGATTVAGTIIAADLADIPVFVTGGIGGVHHGGEDTMDVSADLNELGRSRTLVVCSGVKSILDIGRTLEYLETQGVCVAVFGDSDEFPAFYTVRSGHRAPYHIRNAERAARLLHAANTLRLGSGIVVAVPVPKEHAMDETTIENAISSALNEADKKHIHGKEVTPFILAAVANATKGASLAANIALIKNNAKVGADIAVEFNKLSNVDNLENASNIGFWKRAEKSTLNPSRGFHTSFDMRAETTTFDIENNLPISQQRDLENPVLVIGGANVDRNYRVTEEQIQLDGSTHACKAEHCAGGVGRNVAEALWRLRQGRVRLLTAIGDDADGHYLNSIAPGLILDGCMVKGARTPTYAAVLDAKGECRLGVGDMALHDHITIDLVNKNVNVLEKAPLVVLDGNIPQSTMDHVLELCHRLRKPVFFEPTDRRKAVKFFHKHRRPHVAYASPNLAELRAISNFINPNFQIEKTAGLIHEILGLSKIVIQLIDVLIVTIGANGVIIIRRNNDYRTKISIKARLYPVKVINAVESVSGAGDCFASGFIHGALLGKSEALCVSMGIEAAKRALLAKDTVPCNLDVNKISNEALYEILI